MRRAVALGLVLAIAACTGGGDDSDDVSPDPTRDEATSTTVIDRSGIALTGVPGATTSTIVEVGTATIGGVVQGPNGVVVGATVRLERLVAGRTIRTDLVTGPDGRYLLENVPGGRYRIRAFLAPTLAQTEPEVRFLEDEAAHDIPLTVTDQSGLRLIADVAPEPPLLGDPVNLVVVVLSRRVDADGIVRSSPVIGTDVELAGLGRWELRDEPPPDEEDPDDTTTSSTFGITTTTTAPRAANVDTTNAAGRVRFELECEAPGDPGLYVRIEVRVAETTVAEDGTTTVGPSRLETRSFELDLPACVDPATTTTTTVPTSSTATTVG